MPVQDAAVNPIGLTHTEYLATDGPQMANCPIGASDKPAPFGYLLGDDLVQEDGSPCPAPADSTAAKRVVSVCTCIC